MLPLGNIPIDLIEGPRVSFARRPVFHTAHTSHTALSQAPQLVAALGLIIFLASIVGVLGDTVMGLRVDLVMFIAVALLTATILVFNSRNPAVE